MNGSRLFDLYGNASEWTRDTDGYRLETVSGTTLCIFSSPTARVRLRESDCASPTARVLRGVPTMAASFDILYLPLNLPKSESGKVTFLQILHQVHP